MEERGAGGFRKDTVDRLLRLNFRDGRTRVNADAQLLVAELLKVFVRGERAGPSHQPWSDGSGSSPAPLGCSRPAPLQAWPSAPRSSRAPGRIPPPGQQPGAPADSSSPSHCPSFSCPWAAEAAARAARQAQAEDLKKVDTEQLEKVLPQLLLDF
ncbi:centromere protein X isoform X1 [Passer domesticus]|uniref:centromere protein X isoform X1 n=1 Tax=Passer domesticus TaxID=48849 RepID=UPI0030FE9A2D